MKNITSLICLVCTVFTSLTAQIKILPLGNSITYNHYRYDLWKQLLDAELDFDFIGLQNNFPSGGGFLTEFPDYRGQVFDAQHEGHPGWTTNDLLEGESNDPNAGKLPDWLAAYTPDVVLLHVGTNDVTHRAADHTVANIVRMIRMLQNDNPNVAILLAKIIPRSGYFQQVVAINDRLDEVAMNTSTETSCVRIVDQYTNYSAEVDNYDGIHPNRSGDVKMARKWATAVVEVIKNGDCRVVIDCSQLEVQLEADEIDCHGAQNGALRPIINGGVAPFAYTWSTGERVYNINNLNPGNYTVTVTDGNNCAASATLTIDSPPALRVQVNRTDIAYFNTHTGRAEVVVTGGRTPYQYLWNTGATTADIEGLAAGDYAVTISDRNGCTISRSVTITQPDCVPEVLETEIQPLTCADVNDATITILNSRETDQISWSTGQQRATITGLAAGDYQVTVTTSEGCVSTTTVTLEAVPDFTLSTTAEPTRCGENNGRAAAHATGGTGLLRYAWNTGDTVAVIENLPGGMYQISVTDANQCERSATVTVAASTAMELNGQVEPPACADQANGRISLVINHGTPPFNYEWNNGSQENSLSDLAAGDYSLTLTDSSGCMATQSFVVNDPPPLQIAVATEHPFGEATGRIALDIKGGTPPYALEWNTGQTEAVIEDLPAGDYTAAITDANGCALTTTITLELQTATATVNSKREAIQFYQTGDELCVKTNLPLNTDNQLLIFTTDGKLIQRAAFHSSQVCVTLDHLWYAGHVFIVQFWVAGEPRYVGKLIK